MLDVKRRHSFDISYNKDAENIETKLMLILDRIPKIIIRSDEVGEVTVSGSIVSLIQTSDILHKEFEVICRDTAEISIGPVYPPVEIPDTDKDVIQYKASIGVIPGTADIIAPILRHSYGGMWNRYTQSIVSILENYVTNHTSMLDLGCSIGIQLLFAEKYGATRIVGVDRCSRDLEAAKKAIVENKCKNIEIVESDIYKYINTCGNTFDLIICNQSVDEFKRLLPNIRTCMAEGGTAILGGFLIDGEEKAVKLITDNSLSIIQRHVVDNAVSIVVQ